MLCLENGATGVPAGAYNPILRSVVVESSLTITAIISSRCGARRAVPSFSAIVTLAHLHRGVRSKRKPTPRWGLRSVALAIGVLAGFAAAAAPSSAAAKGPDCVYGGSDFRRIFKQLYPMNATSTQGRVWICVDQNDAHPKRVGVHVHGHLPEGATGRCSLKVWVTLWVGNAFKDERYQEARCDSGRPEAIDRPDAIYSKDPLIPGDRGGESLLVDSGMEVYVEATLSWPQSNRPVTGSTSVFVDPAQHSVYRAGQEISFRAPQEISSCTGAFLVSVLGVRGVSALSAGHCGDKGWEVWRFGGRPHHRFGKVLNSVYSTAADALVFSVDGTAAAQEIERGGQPPLKVSGLVPTILQKRGMRVCFTGRVSGADRCGKVLFRKANGRLCTDIGLQQGDSGAPVYSQTNTGTTKAVGILYGGYVSGPGPDGARMCYTPLETAMRAVGATWR